ncbi:erythropoietin receptor isoform X2 [Carcharodon carcharias]|uniref:erythropoietin receptor isoform X2 n=1 Tax=Carcharodon carcharias TaxID=13397 RepID=UPI001B7F5B63|nr:erythropoietin receptor isoform X2 [Carcharodon carcharias]
MLVCVYWSQNTSRSYRAHCTFTTGKTRTMVHPHCHQKIGSYLFVLSAAAVLKARSLNLENNTGGSESLSCFTKTLEEFFCFWDEWNGGNNNKYRLSYQYLYQDDGEKKECPLSMERIGDNMIRYICTFPMMDVSLFAPLEIEVSLNSSVITSRQDIYINKLVILDPPSNVTVQRTGKPDQIHVKWSAPQLKYLENSLMYEVNFSSVGSNVQKVETIKKKTECIITKLKSQTEYLVSIRAKPDGLSIDGYWTVWSEPVSVITDSDLDPLILSLSLVLVMIIMLLFLTLLMTHRRVIKEKIWPLVPSPENMFDGLFTVYRGNFQEWLGRSSVQIWWNLQFFSTNEPASALEILSEVKTFPPDLVKIKHQEVFLDEQSFLVPGFDPLKLQRETLMDEGKLPARVQVPSDNREAYVILNQNFLSGNTSLSDACSLTQNSNDVSDEEMPLQLLFESSGMSSQEDKSSTRGEDSLQDASISCQSSLSSGIEQGSPVTLTCFDYAKCDSGGQLLYLNPLRVKLERDRYYPYLQMSDSGVSADFSITDFQLRRNTVDTGAYTNLYRREDFPECTHASGSESFTSSLTFKAFVSEKEVSCS